MDPYDLGGFELLDERIFPILHMCDYVQGKDVKIEDFNFSDNLFDTKQFSCENVAANETNIIALEQAKKQSIAKEPVYHTEEPIHEVEEPIYQFEEHIDEFEDPASEFENILSQFRSIQRIFRNIQAKMHACDDDMKH